MHIQESATQQLEQGLLRQRAQVKTDREQPQTIQQNSEIGIDSPAALQMALAGSGLGFWDWDLISDKIYYDPDWQRILGYELEEITNHHQSFERFVHPQDLPRVHQVLNNYLGGCISSYEVEFRILTKSGAWKWILERGKVFKWDESGKPIRMTGICQDITEKKLLQEALVQQQRREKLICGIQERIHTYSRLEPILQTTVEQVRQFLQIDRTLIYRFHSDGSGMVAFESVAEGWKSLQGMDIPAGNFYQFNRCFCTVSSQSCQCDLLDQPEVKASLVIPIFARVEDRQNHADSTIQNRKSKIQNPLWGLLIAHNYCSNHEWQEWEIESLKQLSREIAIAVQQCQLTEQVQKAIGDRQQAEAQTREKSQQLEMALHELKNAQGQLLQNEKMANLGELVANIANEINNPVSFIYGSLHPATQHAEDLIRLLELYQHYYPKPTSVIDSHIQRLDLDYIKTDFLKLLWSMRSGSERIKDIVFALRNFSQFEDGQMRQADLHEGIDSVLRILQHRLKEQPERPGIQVIKEFGELPLVQCYPGELNQVFMNILTNAIEALEYRMKQDGSFCPRIWIRTEIISSHLSLVSSNEPKTIDKLPLKKHKIIIRISDNGNGILPHIQRRIFELFFTTKPIGKGKGLGLPISQQIIVEKHQGKLKCNSRLGQGTEFVIEMPAKTTSCADDIRKHASF